MFAPEAIAIFAPPSYQEAIWTVPSVALSVFFMFLYTFFATFEFYYEKTQYIAGATVGGALLNIGLNYICIQKFGYIAAGYTTLFSYMLFALLHYYFMRKICKEYLNDLRPYNAKIILGISVGCLVAGFGIMATYKNNMIRYAVIAALAVALFCMRKKLMELVKMLLEIKKKIGGIVNKRRITLTLKEAEAYMQRGIHPVDNGKYVRRLVLEELDHFCDRYAPLVPKQYISYQRAAFFGKDDPNFRLTFDRQLTQRRTNLNLSSGDFGSLLIPENSHLMEVKIGGAMPIWLAQQLAALRIYKISFSKYGTAYRLYCTAEQQTKEKRNVSYV